MVTEQEAKDMRDMIQQVEQTEEQQRETQNQADITIAERWFNSLGINIQRATTRTQALRNFKRIESLLQTETNSFRKSVLSKKLIEAAEKYKAVKKVNPNS